MPINYGAMPGGYYNPARISNAQAKYAPMQAQANAMLPMEQAQYMPYQIQAQMLSNPMLWMASQGNPGMMQSMIGNITNSLPKTNMMNSMPVDNGGGLLGGLLSHIFSNKQSTPSVSAAPGMPVSSGGSPVTQLPGSQMTTSGRPAIGLPDDMAPLALKAGITGATALEGQPGWYHGYQNGKSVKFRMQP